MPSLVQEKDNHSATGVTSITVTLSANVTAGNGVVVAISGTSNPTFTVSGGSDTFTSAVADANTYTAIFYVLSSAGGYTTLTIGGNASSNGLSAWVYEVPKLQSKDSTNSGTNLQATPWSSGSSTGNFASEFVVGVDQSVYSTSASTITGPSSPWTNETSYIMTTQYIAISGYQITSSTGSYTYSGTATGTGSFGYGSCVAVFQFSSALVPPSVQLRQAVKRAAYF